MSGIATTLVGLLRAEVPIRQQWRSAAQSRIRLRCARRRDSSQRFGGVVAVQVDTACAVVDVGDRFGVDAGPVNSGAGCQSTGGGLTECLVAEFGSHWWYGRESRSGDLVPAGDG